MSARAKRIWLVLGACALSFGVARQAMARNEYTGVAYKPPSRDDANQPCSSCHSGYGTKDNITAKGLAWWNDPLGQDADGFSIKEELQTYHSDPLKYGDINECWENLDDCHPSAYCNDGWSDHGGRNDYTCTCSGGYTGNGKGTNGCVDIDECANAATNCPDTHSTCEDYDGGYDCTCDSGYFGSGKPGLGCTAVDYCAENPCSPLSTCLPIIGGHLCQACVGGVSDDCPHCPPGYEGDGEGPDGCVDVDECATANTCSPLVDCTNTPGSFTCGDCPVGYWGDSSVACEKQWACAPADCSAFGRCATEGCVCNDGFVGDGVECEDVDECQSDASLCDEHSSCVNVPGSYLCACNSGFVEDGSSCVEAPTCATWTGECGSYAECKDGPPPHCLCKEGYGGTFPDCVPPKKPPVHAADGGVGGEPSAEDGWKTTVTDDGGCQWAPGVAQAPGTFSWLLVACAGALTARARRSRKGAA